ncbi:MAG: hypothetical protein K8H87_08920, partial [Pseudorhodoplanes sp.]|nr:hypothetical protein [Pseudorhodoplanes sp.]
RNGGGVIPSVFDLDLSALSLPGLTRQSIILRRLFFFATDARVRLARGRSEIGAGGISSTGSHNIIRRHIRT